MTGFMNLAEKKYATIGLKAGLHAITSGLPANGEEAQH